MGRRGQLETLRRALVANRSHLNWPEVPNPVQQTQDTAAYESGITPEMRRAGYVVIAFTITGFFIMLAGFGVSMFGGISGFPIIFVGFVIFIIGIAIGMVTGVRYAGIARRFRQTD